jgi:ElaB/YqjD/DUF883 family membrane-anchored ribosome-binding protein
MPNEELDSELDKVKSDIADLREDMAELLHIMKNAGIAEGRKYYDRAYERAQHAGESVRERANDAYASIGKEVEERPLASMLTAFATGFFVSMLLDRRH